MSDSASSFPGCKKYWEDRYRSGGTSGTGSYGRLAEFKAEVINQFVAENAVGSVIEFGCGDGNQLSLAQYPTYIGLDVSPTAIGLCKKRFAADRSKSFFCYDPDCFVDHHGLFSADLALSLEVIFHLVEDGVYEQYLRHLFSSAKQFVIAYTSNHDQTTSDVHVRHRHVTAWVERNLPNWTLMKQVENRYPFDVARPGETSFSKFLIFSKHGSL
jgi:hypothetical protein